MRFEEAHGVSRPFRDPTHNDATLDGGYKLFSAVWMRLLERQKVTTRCANCEWVVTGPLEEVRVQFTAHRTQAHPSVVVRLPNPRARSVSAAMRQAA